jgi:hypothetical protein
VIAKIGIVIAVIVGAVGAVLRRARGAGLTWEPAEAVGEDELQGLLYARSTRPSSAPAAGVVP